MIEDRLFKGQVLVTIKMVRRIDAAVLSLLCWMSAKLLGGCVPGSLTRPGYSTQILGEIFWGHRYQYLGNTNMNI